MTSEGFPGRPNGDECLRSYELAGAESRSSEIGGSKIAISRVWHDADNPRELILLADERTVDVLAHRIFARPESVGRQLR